MNVIFRIILQKARKLITNPDKAKKVMDEAMGKSDKLEGEESFIDTIKSSVPLFFDMLGDFFAGKYRKFPLKTGIKLLGALIYFVFVIDLVPDFLLGIGLLDDAAVLAWVIQSIGGDIDKYKLWKEGYNDNETEFDLEQIEN